MPIVSVSCWQALVVLTIASLAPVPTVLAQSIATPSADYDLTYAGRKELAELANRAANAVKTVTTVEKELSSLYQNRENARLQHSRFAQLKQKADLLYQGHSLEIAKLNRALPTAPNAATLGQIMAELDQRKQAREAAAAESQNAQRKIEEAESEIKALITKIEPLEKEQAAAIDELSSARIRWREVTLPVMRLARGDFEILASYLEYWLARDPYWTEALVLRALAAHLLGDPATAEKRLREAEKVHDAGTTEPGGNPVIEALKALIHDDRKAEVVALRLTRHARDRAVAGHAYCILARLHAAMLDNSPKARAYLENAIKSDPDNLCAQADLARWQLASPDTDDNEMAAGIRTLEDLWNQSAYPSWRLAFDLHNACRRMGNAEEERKYRQVLLTGNAPEAIKRMLGE
ncbi:MAG: hypothetical protein KF777_05615 [Planctomycetaceae bacterium]|nr:hypothetical protein [Planctomycetaceae bacterium]